MNTKTIKEENVIFRMDNPFIGAITESGKCYILNATKQWVEAKSEIQSLKIKAGMMEAKIKELEKQKNIEDRTKKVVDILSRHGFKLSINHTQDDYGDSYCNFKLSRKGEVLIDFDNDLIINMHTEDE